MTETVGVSDGPQQCGWCLQVRYPGETVWVDANDGVWCDLTCAELAGAP
jgi:hypothetical protein